MKFFLSLILLLVLSTMAFSANPPAKSTVYIIKISDRTSGVKALLKEFKLPDLKNKKVIIKPNFNSDDPFPATTHLDTLKTVLEAVKAESPQSVTIVERSGMGETEEVLINRGVTALTEAEGVTVVNLDKLAKKNWVKKGEKGTHWRKGYLVPKMVLEADYVVNLCCLKTHRFGGDFTLSLKNN